MLQYVTEQQAIKAVQFQRRVVCGNVDGENAIEAIVTVDDPGAFNAPWSGLVRWTKFNRPLIESTCAENNENYGKFLGLREYPMPKAKKPDF